MASINQIPGLAALFQPLDPTVDGMGNLAPQDYRQNALSLLQQAGNVQPQIQRPKLGTMDALAGLAALLAGNQGGELLGGYAQGRAQGIQQNNQLAQQNAEGRRRALTQSAEGLFRTADAQDNRANQRYLADLNNQARVDVAGIGANSRENVAGIKAEADTQKAKYLFEGKKLDNETKALGLELASADRTAKAMLDTLMKLPAGARPGFAQNLANQPQFSGWSPESIEALGELTASEEAKKAQAANFRAQTGYYGARARNVDALTQAQKDVLIKRAEKADADADVAIAKLGLIEAQANLVKTKTANYIPEFRAKVAAAEGRRIAAADKRDSGEQEKALKALLSLTSKQIQQIKAENKGKAPSSLLDPAGALAYAQLVTEQQQLQDQLKGIAKSRASINPVTSGRAPGTLPGNGGVSGAIGGGNRTRGGTKYRVVQ